MPFVSSDILFAGYFVVIAAAIILGLVGLVVLIRLMLATTRALNIYVDERRLRTELLLDPVDTP